MEGGGAVLPRRTVTQVTTVGSGAGCSSNQTTEFTALAGSCGQELPPVHTAGSVSASEVIHRDSVSKMVEGLTLVDEITQLLRDSSVRPSVKSTSIQV